MYNDQEPFGTSASVSKPRGNALETPYEIDYRNGEKIHPGDLEERGFRLTARFFVVAGGYKIYELQTLDPANRREYCFLVPGIKSPGVILSGYANRRKSATLAATARIRKPKPVQKFEVLPSQAAEEAPKVQRQVVFSHDARHYRVVL